MIKSWQASAPCLCSILCTACIVHVVLSTNYLLYSFINSRNYPLILKSPASNRTELSHWIWSMYPSPNPLHISSVSFHTRPWRPIQHISLYLIHTTCIFVPNPLHIIVHSGATNHLQASVAQPGFYLPLQNLFHKVPIESWRPIHCVLYYTVGPLITQANLTCTWDLNI